MTVQEMLNIPFFSDMIVAGGQDGLFREVTSVSVMDAPDIYEWMKGGEFLITTAYIFKDSPEGMLPLIRRLNQAGIAAFGVKTDRFLGELPEEIVAEADRLVGLSKGRPIHLAHATAAGCGTHTGAAEGMQRVIDLVDGDVVTAEFVTTMLREGKGSLEGLQLPAAGSASSVWSERPVSVNWQYSPIKDN